MSNIWVKIKNNVNDNFIDAEIISSDIIWDKLKRNSEPFDKLQLFENPLMSLPYNIRENITTEFYEAGMQSMAQKYIEDVFLNNESYINLQELFNKLYFYAVKHDSHILANNIIIILSQIPYKYLGTWADMLAVAATRNKYMDIVEMGIRCFENWENKSSCEFLKECKFTETWLQKYAQEVCEYILEDGKESDVLFEENYSWKMAGRVTDSSSGFEGYFGRYSSYGIEN